MGDQWDYRLCKVEMAWELASKNLFERSPLKPLPAKEDYYKVVRRELQEAWDAVNSVFPTFEE